MKRVRFSEDPPKVHQMVVWSFAHRQARKSNWETEALDRFRFQQRILNCECILSKVLSKEHRDKLIATKQLDKF